MNIDKTIATLRAMNEDGVNHVGYAADVIEALQKGLAEETKNKQQFERDWSECCDALVASQAREKVLRDALVGLIGADGEQELRQMEVAMRMLPAPDADKAVSINAIHALQATVQTGGKCGQK